MPFVQIQNHLDGVLVGHHAHGGEHEDQDRPLQQQRQAAGGGADVLLLVKLHHLLIELFLVVGVLLLQRLNLGLQCGWWRACCGGTCMSSGISTSRVSSVKMTTGPAVVAHPAVDPVQGVHEKDIDPLKHSESSKGNWSGQARLKRDLLAHAYKKMPSRGPCACAGQRTAGISFFAETS